MGDVIDLAAERRKRGLKAVPDRALEPAEDDVATVTYDEWRRTYRALKAERQRIICETGGQWSD